MAKTANKSTKTAYQKDNVDLPEHALTKNEVTRLKKMLAKAMAEAPKQRDKDVILRAKLIMLQKELA